MKKNRTFTLLVLILSLLSAFAIFSFADSEEKYRLEENRKAEDKCIEAYQNLLANMQNDAVSELCSLNDESADKALSLSDVYAGSYIDNGKLIINVIESSESIAAKIYDSAETRDVIIKEVRFSMDELQKIYSILSSKMSDAPYHYAALMEKENAIYISTENFAECEEYLKSLDINTDAVKITEEKNTLSDYG